MLETKKQINEMPTLEVLKQSALEQIEDYLSYRKMDASGEGIILAYCELIKDKKSLLDSSDYMLKSMIVELLALFSKPEINTHLPEWLRPHVGDLLLSLHYFFIEADAHLSTDAIVDTHLVNDGQITKQQLLCINSKYHELNNNKN
jgi:hypothetical protein